MLEYIIIYQLLIVMTWTQWNIKWMFTCICIIKCICTILLTKLSLCICVALVSCFYSYTIA